MRSKKVICICVTLSLLSTSLSTSINAYAEESTTENQKIKMYYLQNSNKSLNKGEVNRIKTCTVQNNLGKINSLNILSNVKIEEKMYTDINTSSNLLNAISDEVYLNDKINAELKRIISKEDLGNLEILLFDTNGRVQSLSASLSENGRNIILDAPKNGYDIGKYYNVIIRNKSDQHILDEPIVKSFATLKAYTLKSKIWTFNSEGMSTTDIKGITAESINSKGKKFPLLCHQIIMGK